MKSLLIAAGLLALSLSAHAQETIVEYLSDDVVQTAFTENGSSDAQKLSSDGDEPIWAGTIDGYTIYLSGVACDEMNQQCQGLRLISIQNYPSNVTDKAAFLASTNEMFAAVKTASFDDESWMINYYVILNGGVTQQNINELTGIYVDLVETMFDRLSGDAEESE